MVEVVHVYREGNKATDCLVSLANLIFREVKLLQHTPPVVVPFLDDDACGVAWARRISVMF